MKQPLLILMLLIAIHQGYAQGKLADSPQSGKYTRIYRLTDQETFDIAVKSQSVIKDSFFHTLVDSFYYDNKVVYQGKLAYGNYLYVSVLKNQLLYYLVPVQNVDLNFINDLKNVQFSISDTEGREITDATVKIGKRKQVKYNGEAHSYLSKSVPKEKVITVNYKGVNNYFNFENTPLYGRYNENYYRWPVQPQEADKSAYKGYMVFNKPKYKPLDTVKVKTYVLNNDGSLLKNKPLRLEIVENAGYYTYNQQENDEQEGKILKMIKPYRDGGYAFDFVLTDSLDLDLDENYSVVLKELKGDKWKLVYRGNFRYEDYELKAVNFSVRTDQEEFNPGNPVTVYLSARDENDLAVPDGRVVIKAYANNIRNYQSSHVFIPDSLWETEIKMDPVGETKFVLPDSIFPKADLNFSLRFTFLNSNNESQEDNKYLLYSYQSARIKASLKNDSLSFDYLVNGKARAGKAKVTSFDENDKKGDSTTILLPGMIKLDPKVLKYTLITADGHKEDILLTQLRPSLQIDAVHTADSLRLKVSNPQKLKFWYTLFSDNKIIGKGYTERLDSALKHSGKKTAHVRVNYLWAGNEVSQEVSSVYSNHTLNLQFAAPELIYPGQLVDMQVKVTDVNQQAVPFTDLTAYAVTSKFGGGNGVALPYFGKAYQLRKQLPALRELKLRADGNLVLNWLKWGKALGLDTITYYQFTHPEEVFVNEEVLPDTASAQIAPFVMKNGNIVPVHVVYIDEVPVFFSKTDQLQGYSFKIKPGVQHQIRLRTADQMILLPVGPVVKGKKTVISVNAVLKNTKATVQEAPHELTAYEAGLLSKYLLSITDNFNEEKTVLSAGGERYLVNPQPFSRNRDRKLIGPVAENYLGYSSGKVQHTFVKEPGYAYTFNKNLIKQKSFSSEYGFSTDLWAGVKKASDDYKEYAISGKEIDSIWNDYLDLRSHTTNLFQQDNYGLKNTGQLYMKLDTAFAKTMPYVKNILIYKKDHPGYRKILPGNTSWYSAMEAGKYRMMYLFKDNRYFIEEAEIKSKGKNYFTWNGKKVLAADSLSINIDKYIKSAKSDYFYHTDNELIETRVSEIFNAEYFDTNLLSDEVKGKVVDEKKNPLAGVTVRVEGLKSGVTTNTRGEFKIRIPKKATLSFNYIGYNSLLRVVKSNDMGVIVMDISTSSLDEVAVVGYGAQKRKEVTGAVMTVTNSLAGSVPGVMIRGATSASDKALKPMMIVDGLPYNGEMNDFKPEDIAAVDILKDAAATALYGSRAASGVIIIKTKKGNQVQNAAGELVPQQQTMRTNFSDYAFWQPSLLTDAEGIARWKVKFPDDITNWSTSLIAINGNKQSGQFSTFIKSFKSLSANFVSPQFALSGDSIRVIGKLMNYTPLEETVKRKFSYNGQELRNNTIQFKNSHLDTIAIVAAGKDSLSFTYTLEQDNGYFDGELRKIPVLPVGVTETKGYFDVLSADTTVSYHFLPDAGKVTLRAEASVFPALLDEMDRVRKYEYLCNEQLASKLKSLLLEKSVKQYLQMPFKYEKDIKDIIKKLQSNKRAEGTWGWWQDSAEQMWISLHVSEALLKAEKAGYPIQLNKDLLYNYLVGKLANQHDYERVFAIKLIHLLNPNFFIKDWVGTVEKQLDLRMEAYRKEVARRKESSSVKKINPGDNYIPAKPSLNEELQLIRLKQLAGMEVSIQSLLDLHKSTLFGALYWGEESYRFWDNSIQNTLLAYQILKAEGKHAKELELISRYFLEQRKDGQWRNTYESALILETILPDLLIEKVKPEPASLVINQQETVKDFPFTREMDAATRLTISKKGGLPVYFTAYQQFLNPAPEKVGKDFKVKTSFFQNGAAVTSLKAGVQTKLKVEVEVRADAEYVMIEIPVPAGCSYDSKPQSYWGVETHREYFKHKTSIFCTKMKAGKYNFEVTLMPRYSGNYALNPAKAEMMYFPVFYGREGMKRIGVK